MLPMLRPRPPIILQRSTRRSTLTSSSSQIIRPIRSRCLLPRYTPSHPVRESRRFHQTHIALNELAAEPSPEPQARPKFQYRWIYRRPDGKLRKSFIVGVFFIVWGIAHKITMEQRIRIRMAEAHSITMTLYALDKQAYARTDFTNYLATLAYFRALILVTEWPHHRSHADVWHTEPTSRILGPEDFAHFSQGIDTTFQKLAALQPDDPKRQTFHRKLRSTCRDVHSFLNDFNTPDPETGIVALYSRELDDLTMDQKWSVAMVGFGTVTLLRTAWWIRPKY